MEKGKYKINYKPVYWILAISFVVLPVWVWAITNWSFYDLTETGPIGDTIGGLTAPIIGLAGGILVYISFQAQLRANKLQFDALELERRRAESMLWYSNQLSNWNDLRNSFFSVELTLPKNAQTEDELFKDEFNLFKGAYILEFIKKCSKGDYDLNPAQMRMFRIAASEIIRQYIEILQFSDNLEDNSHKYQYDISLIMNEIYIFHYRYCEAFIPSIVEIIPGQNSKSYILKLVDEFKQKRANAGVGADN